jgi:hypothetical protein
MGMTFYMPMGMHYYVNVGHSVHNTMQLHLAQSGTLLADYHCRECKTWHRLSHQHECCGFACEYHEVTISYKGIGGHIDAIFRDRQGRYWIVDFKTTSLASAPGKRLKPGLGYTRQIRAYAYLLWRQYGIKVAGTMLFFIPRDNPRKPVVSEYLMTDRAYDTAFQDLKFDRRLHKDTMVAKTLADFRTLVKHKCGGEYCDACKMSSTRILEEIMHKAKKFPILKQRKEKV